MEARQAAVTYVALVGATLAFGLLATLPPLAPYAFDVPFFLVVAGPGALLLLAPHAVRDERAWMPPLAGALAGAAAAGALGALARTLALVGDPRFTQPSPVHVATQALLALAATGSALWFLGRDARQSGASILAAAASALLVGAIPLAYGWVLLGAQLALVATYLPVRRSARECARAAGLGLALVAAAFLVLVMLDGEARGRGVVTSDPGLLLVFGGLLAALAATLVALLFWREGGWRVRGAFAE